MLVFFIRQVHARSIMRVALFTTTFYPIVGGAEKQLDLLARGLLARGHEPVVIAPEVPRRNNELKVPYEVVRFPRLRTKRWGLRWKARFLEAMHKERPFGLVHAHGAYPAAYMVKDFARRHRLPLIVRAHGGDVLPGEAIAGSPRLRKRMCSALSAAQVVIAQNVELEKLLGHWSGHPERVVRIPNGVEWETYARPIEPNPWQQRDPYAVTLSTYYPKKGLDVLVEAWGKVARERPEAKLLIVGHGPEEGRLKEMIAASNLQGHVELHGNVSGAEKIGMLQAARLYVSSARREPFSNALLEAVAAGCAIVATRVGGNIEVVESLGCGRLVPPENAAALAEALLAEWAAPQRADDIETRCKRAAPFTVETMLERYCEATGL
jgi:glycosyltransferase involved in cell wall biosynthesis